MLRTQSQMVTVMPDKRLWLMRLVLMKMMQKCIFRKEVAKTHMCADDGQCKLKKSLNRFRLGVCPGS